MSNKAGLRLRLMSSYMGLGTEELATLLGVSPRSVRRWKTGEADIPFNVQMIFDETVVRFYDLVDKLYDQAEEQGFIPYAVGSSASPLNAQAVAPSFFNAAAAQALTLCEMDDLKYEIKEITLD